MEKRGGDRFTVSQWKIDISNYVFCFAIEEHNAALMILRNKRKSHVFIPWTSKWDNFTLQLSRWENSHPTPCQSYRYAQTTIY